jgi:copper(I)-binding protein
MRSKGARKWSSMALLLVVSMSARAAGDLKVEDAWIRWLPANLPGAGYMTLTNTGMTERVLLGASSPDYGDVSFHRTVNKNGMSDMTAVDSIAVKPQASVRFAAGGYHLMLMRPKRSLQPGDQVMVTLLFSGGQTVTAGFDVRAGNE